MGALPLSCAHSPHVFRTSWSFLPLRSPGACDSLGFHDFQTHIASRAHDGTDRGVQIGGVEIDKLDLGDFDDLLLGNFADFVAIGFRRTLGDSRRAKEQNGSGRRLQHEREGAVRVDGDEDGENHPVGFFLRLGVELLAEIHDVDAVGAEGGAHRGRRSGLAGRQLQLDGCLYLLWWHLCFTSISIMLRRHRAARIHPSFSTLAKSSSTGVERPKIVTETFRRLWSLSISSTVPLKLANGPSTMRTCSLRSKTTLGFGRSCGVCTRLMMASTSASERAGGAVAEPTKPVTRGVLRTMCQVFSSRSISTRT